MIESKYILSVYEKAMPNDLTWYEKLTMAKQAGFDCLEISVDESDEKLSRLYWTKEQQNKLLKLTRDTDIFINSMCLSGHRKYSIGGKDTAEIGLEIMKRAVEFSYTTGIRIIQLAGYDVYYEPSTSDTEKRFGENLARCVEIAASSGVILGFETMETPFMNTISKAMRYVNLINSPYLQVYPDVGNVSNATRDVTGDILSGSGHIIAAHLKETKTGFYRDLVYGEGHVDFKTCINTLKKIGVRIFNAEFWYDGKSNWKTTLKISNDYLRSFLDREEGI